MKKSILFLVLFFITAGQLALSQADRRDVRKGNKLYRADKFDDAEIKYRQALEQKPQNLTGMFNLGNSFFRQGRYQEAAQKFQSIAQVSPSARTKAQAFHNLGNSLLKAEKYKESIEAYKNSLRINPNDDQTRHNLAYAMRRLQEQPPQDGDGKSNENNDQQNQQNQNQNQNQENNNKEQQQKQQPGQISPQDAERILNALNQKEQKIQENINKNQKSSPARHEREW